MKYYSLISKTNFKGKYEQIAEGFIIEKQSKFISYLFSIEDEKGAIEKIDKIRRENPQARHVVYIYSYFKNNIANIRFSDDGEPKGTGTKAIYELLEKECITNLCIVIVRYFGGILLGAGPLSRVYLNSARECINLCEKKELYNYIEYNIECSYNTYNIIKKRIEKYADDGFVVIKDSVFKENIVITLDIVDFKFEDIKKVIEEVKYGN